MDQIQVRDFFETQRPKYVIDAAAKVGGIKANMTFPAEFLYENLQIQNNLIWSAKENNITKLLFISSACIYPIDADQPMAEHQAMQGKLETANEAYAYAKISGMKLCEFIHDELDLNFLSCVPTNIYGEYADFDSDNLNVIPSLIRRIHEAKINEIKDVTIWGTGVSRRDFLYVADLADAIVFLMENYDEKHFLNIGTGQDVSIKELAIMIKNIVGYNGDLVFDADKPGGVPKRLLDVTKLHDLGWKHKVDLDSGLKRTYKWFLNQSS